MLHISSMKIGKAIAEIRKEKGLSQNKFSSLAELNRGYLYKLENDSISPTIATLELIAEKLDVNLRDIIIRAEKIDSELKIEE